MTKPAINRGGAAATALVHLAENGPTPEDGLRSVMAEGKAKTAGASAGVTLRRLEAMGLVRTKVWLTPEGLAEAQRLGLLAPRAGVVEAQPA